MASSVKTKELSKIVARQDGVAFDTTLRLAMTSEDARQIAMINVRAWQRAYKGLLPDELLNRLNVRAAAAGWEQRIKEGVRIWLVEHAGAVRGFASIGVCLDDDCKEDTAELFTIYLEPEYIGMKLGKTLLRAALDDLRNSEFNDCVVWFLVGNEPARKFYESVGFKNDHREKRAIMNGTEMHEKRYRIDFR